MLGYVFITENLENSKKFIGKNLSVTFDANYYGDNEDLLNDVVKYGRNNFKVTMLSACEDPRAVDAVYGAYISEYDAFNNPDFYNYIKKSGSASTKSVSASDTIDVKPKRSRKKKDESLS